MPPLLRISGLRVTFATSGGDVPAVDGLSLSVWPDQTLALVGESGCGKSVTALSILRLLPSPPARFAGGTIEFDGRDLLKLPEKQMLDVRGGEIAMIFQEPMTSLNPVYTIGDQIVEAILLHQPVKHARAREIAAKAMADVGIPEPGKRLHDYPHQFSGGMRQRAMIAMALACEPRLLLADEPTTALDVTIQAQILDLLQSLQRDRHMAMILITHDLGVVAQYADVVCVMYAGRPVEYARVEDLYDRPGHPYTRGLLASIPRIGDPRDRLTTVAQVTGDPAEFRKLPGAGDGVIPWWPHMDPPEGLAPPKAQGDSVLHEIEPDHWVGCWRTTYLEHHPSPACELDYRRAAAAV